MWTDTTVISTMGLHATSKRKHDLDFDKKEKDTYLTCSPVKTTKWSIDTNSTTTVASEISEEGSIAKLEAVVAAPCEPWNNEPMVDCISKLQAVAVPSDTWGNVSTRSTLATTLLNSEELDDDDDDFEDDYEEEESIIPTYCPLKYPLMPQRNYSSHGYTKPNYYSEPFPQQNCSRTGNSLFRMSNFTWSNQNSSYYVPGEASYSQQTIRCAENGKSYLELGSSSFNASIDAMHSKRCCDGRGTWCNSKNCYKEIRLKIRNLSMFKLSRFRQVSEQSLYRSVLICNTLKKIDTEIEYENKDASMSVNVDYSSPLSCARIPSVPTGTSNQGFQQQNQFSANSSDTRDCSVTYNTLNAAKSLSLPFNNSMQCTNDPLHPYDHYPFRDNNSGRATPFPATLSSTTDNDSGYGDEDGNRSINWGSVLSLSSQSALDPLNNNDLFSILPPTSISAPTTISGTFTASSMNNSINHGTATGNTTWEYGFLDMDLGLGSDLAELVPSCKLSSDELFKTVSPSINSSKYVHENEIESPAHIMVGS